MPKWTLTRFSLAVNIPAIYKRPIKRSLHDGFQCKWWGTKSTVLALCLSEANVKLQQFKLVKSSQCVSNLLSFQCQFPSVGYNVHFIWLTQRAETLYYLQNLFNTFFFAKQDLRILSLISHHLHCRCIKWGPSNVEYTPEDWVQRVKPFNVHLGTWLFDLKNWEPIL